MSLADVRDKKAEQRQGSEISNRSSQSNSKRPKDALTFQQLKKRGFVNLVPRPARPSSKHNEATSMSSRSGLKPAQSTPAFNPETTIGSDGLKVGGTSLRGASRGGNRQNRLTNAFDLTSQHNQDTSTNLNSSIKVKSDTEEALPSLDTKNNSRGKSSMYGKKKSANASYGSTQVIH